MLGSRRVAMEREPRAGVALVPGRCGRGPSSRHRRPGLLLPGLWLLLLAGPASCASGKHRRDPRDAAATLARVLCRARQPPGSPTRPSSFILHLSLALLAGDAFLFFLGPANKGMEEMNKCKGKERAVSDRSC